MRVIAGRAKGTRLAAVPEGTRPVSDRAREGLFSCLGSRVPGARVLDLYAGTGAMGIEALSRGADRATFVDHGSAAIRAIRDNLSKTRMAEQAEVLKTDVGRFLGGPEREFDLVFLDPPYGMTGSQLEMALVGVSGGWLAGEDGLVALTRPSKASMPVIPVNWQVARRLSYGDSQILLFREA